MGKAYSDELFLGRYTLKETKQPAGYVLSEEEWNVELSYKDQETAVTTEHVASGKCTGQEFVLAKKEKGTEKMFVRCKICVLEKVGDDV